ncbi:hypothetical protein SAMN05216389_11859 [Oceanobacillus limi]|uniref:Uncharacterized protein n=1 Tax=Oceanobacillus limi TaxID=930131 RepID=A0A1I0G1U5_9BACI|nr:hypothetical protein [Oceanobacillus limi]SET64704.1 hypothetical protein SAMN05216389_11859 [Oceanobacillus limi]
MDYIIFILFTVVASCLLIGTTKREKKWIGGTAGVLAVIFIVVSQVIKFQSGYFESRTGEAAEAVGQWVAPSYIALGCFLIGMINYRWIKAALKQQSWHRWSLIMLDVLFSLLLFVFGYFSLFFVAFMYFPFAP